MKLSVIIACRNEVEGNLLRTIDSLKATIGKRDEIHVVLDGDQPPYPVPAGVEVHASPWKDARGCAAARDYGAEKSFGDALVFCDGHMRFPEGWAARVKAHLSGHRLDLTCCRMQSMDQQWNDIPGQLYHGAWICLDSREDGRQFWALSAKWNRKDPGPGPTGAVMGACYGILREHYFRMHRPLQILDAWGGDEEILSICTWLCGGQCVLLHDAVGHVYGANKRGGKPLSRSEIVRIWSNRFAVLAAIPMSDAELDAAHLWLARNTGIPLSEAAAAIEKPDRRAAIARVRKHLAQQPTTWADYRDRWVSRLTPEEQAARECNPEYFVARASERRTRSPRTLTTQTTNTTPIIVRKTTLCWRCGARDSYRQAEGLRIQRNFQTAALRCSECGAKARLRLID